jgi:hypothetical protein
MEHEIPMKDRDNISYVKNHQKTIYFDDRFTKDIKLFIDNFKYLITGSPKDIIHKLKNMDNTKIKNISSLYKEITNKYKVYNNDYYAFFMGYKYMKTGMKKYIFVPTYKKHTNNERNNMEKRIRFFPNILIITLNAKNNKKTKTSEKMKNTLTSLGFGDYII